MPTHNSDTPNSGISPNSDTFFRRKCHCFERGTVFFVMKSQKFSLNDSVLLNMVLVLVGLIFVDFRHKPDFLICTRVLKLHDLTLSASPNLLGEILRYKPIKTVPYSTISAV